MEALTDVTHGQTPSRPWRPVWVGIGPRRYMATSVTRVTSDVGVVVGGGRMGGPYGVPPLDVPGRPSSCGPDVPEGVRPCGGPLALTPGRPLPDGLLDDQGPRHLSWGRLGSWPRFGIPGPFGLCPF